jgi:hypothetical protein
MSRHQALTGHPYGVTHLAWCRPAWLVNWGGSPGRCIVCLLARAVDADCQAVGRPSASMSGSADDHGYAFSGSPESVGTLIEPILTR